MVVLPQTVTQRLKLQSTIYNILQGLVSVLMNETPTIECNKEFWALHINLPHAVVKFWCVPSHHLTGNFPPRRQALRAAKRKPSEKRQTLNLNSLGICPQPPCVSLGMIWDVYLPWTSVGFCHLWPVLPHHHHCHLAIVVILFFFFFFSFSWTLFLVMLILNPSSWSSCPYS